MSNDLLEEPFHFCALAAGFIAYVEGRLSDSDYVKHLCYAMYEEELARNQAACPLSAVRHSPVSASRPQVRPAAALVATDER